VRTVALTADLQRSREQLVAAREEERRRLRRELHDGLGPTLAGIAIRAEAGRRAVTDRPAATVDALDAIAAEAQAAVVEIRRLAHDLRPPALDDLGLAGALRALAERFADRVPVAVAIAEPLGELPAAVEVAAYRIASEAVTNAARHARATRARLSLAASDHGLELVVADDGGGLARDHPTGVGLASMRERAAELGGSCTVASGPGGTVVTAVLPLVRPTNAPAPEPAAVEA
jgi:signal transduction histidine kinase